MVIGVWVCECSVVRCSCCFCDSLRGIIICLRVGFRVVIGLCLLLYVLTRVAWFRRFYVGSCGVCVACDVVGFMFALWFEHLLGFGFGFGLIVLFGVSCVLRCLLWLRCLMFARFLWFGCCSLVCCF